MNYPIQLRFKKISLTNKIRVIDAGGQEIAYVHQKLLKLKEEIAIYSDSTKTTQLFTLKADRVIDWSPEYVLTDAQHQHVGSYKRQGARSLLNATYDISIGKTTLQLKEQNPWIKLLDALLGSIPFIGAVLSIFVNPTYVVRDSNQETIALLHKRPAFFEGFYEIEAVSVNDLDDKEQLVLALLLMGISTLEQQRG